MAHADDSGAGSRIPWASSLALGQAISVLITGTGIFSTELANYRVNVPVLQSSLNYVLLSAHILWELPRIARAGLTLPAWRYALWALVDVEANALVVWAYQYTSIASVMLLDCFTIPCAMILSRCALGARYTKFHIIACLLCTAGLVLTVSSDVQSKGSGPSPHGPAWLGDVLVLCGAALYGVSNVLQEAILKGLHQRCEALGMLGVFGSLISGVQAFTTERAAVATAAWTLPALFYLLGFQLCLFSMYVLTSVFLLGADAALFNLSLLTSDVYSVLFSWLVQHQKFSWVYGAAFTTTVTGLVLYHRQPPPVVPSPASLVRMAAPSDCQTVRLVRHVEPG
mmetsp:Transcript_76508/g.140029  ORF Transcript_76508/g.140029 Transcript_76508/m.140029 type:complete len:340 (-) Transcript_76508:50-1069(-)